MEREYNWKAISWAAVPVSVVLLILYYYNFAVGIFNLYSIIGIIIAIAITYYLDKKKHNIFTSPFIVLIVILVFQGLRNLNFL